MSWEMYKQGISKECKFKKPVLTEGKESVNGGGEKLEFSVFYSHASGVLNPNSIWISTFD